MAERSAIARAETPAEDGGAIARFWDNETILVKLWPPEKALWSLRICKGLRKRLSGKVQTQILEARGENFDPTFMLVLNWSDTPIQCKLTSGPLSLADVKTESRPNEIVSTVEGNTEAMMSWILSKGVPFGDCLLRAQFSNTNLGPGEIGVVTEKLKQCTRLTMLSLSSSAIQDSEAEKLSQAIAGCTTLRRLVLKENLLGPQGAAALAKGVRACTRLTHLDLSEQRQGWNGEDVELLAFALADLDSLSHLNLSRNGIDNAAAGLLATKLANLHRLRRLNLSHNAITYPGMAAIGMAFMSTSLQLHIDLRGNDVSESEKDSIQKDLPNCSVIVGEDNSPKRRNSGEAGSSCSAGDASGSTSDLSQSGSAVVSPAVKRAKHAHGVHADASPSCAGCDEHAGTSLVSALSPSFSFPSFEPAAPGPYGGSAHAVSELMSSDVATPRAAMSPGSWTEPQPAPMVSSIMHQLNTPTLAPDPADAAAVPSLSIGEHEPTSSKERLASATEEDVEA